MFHTVTALEIFWLNLTDILYAAVCVAFELYLRGLSINRMTTTSRKDHKVKSADI